MHRQYHKAGKVGKVVGGKSALQWPPSATASPVPCLQPTHTESAEDEEPYPTNRSYPTHLAYHPTQYHTQGFW